MVLRDLWLRDFGVLWDSCLSNSRPRAALRAMVTWVVLGKDRVYSSAFIIDFGGVFRSLL